MRGAPVRFALVLVSTLPWAAAACGRSWLEEIGEEEDAGTDAVLLADHAVDRTLHPDVETTDDAAPDRYRCPAPPGSLDPTFGDGGIATVSLEDWEHDGRMLSVMYPVGMAVDEATGKTVLAGQSYTDLVSNQEFPVLIQVLADGTRDPDFHLEWLRSDGGYARGSARDVTFQPDGRIVVATWILEGVKGKSVLVRYMQDGTLDRSFGDDGVLDACGGIACEGIIAAPDGSLWVSMNSYGLPSAIGLLHLHSDGSPDLDFGTGGMAMVALDVFASAATPLLQADGRAVLGAILYQNFADGGLVGPGTFFRFEADGGLDRGFGSDGRASSDVPTWANRFAIGPDQALYASGMNTPDEVAVVRFRPDGTLDPSFGDAGRVTIASESPYIQLTSTGLRVQPNNDVVLLILGTLSTSADSSLFRFLAASGARDPGFGDAGITIVPDTALRLAMWRDRGLLGLTLSPPSASWPSVFRACP